MNLLDLPLETRCQIMKLLLTRPCPVDVLFEQRRKYSFDLQGACVATHDPEVDGCSYLDCLQGLRDPVPANQSINDIWTCVGPLFSIDILRVCKQLYVEAVDILYAGNKFVLTATNLREIPLVRSNISRIKSLHLKLLYLQPGLSLVDHKRMIEHLRPNPGVNLTVTLRTHDTALVNSIVPSMLLLAPVNSCSLSLGRYDKAKTLATKLLGQKESNLFPKYNDLPLEIRRQVLSYTDLVQNYQISDGKLRFIMQCCRRCSDTLSPCCCNTTSRTNRRVTPGAKFSDRCTCKSDPRAMLLVSSGFRAEALDVMFSQQSRFSFSGRLVNHISFLRNIEQHLHHMRTIEITMSYRDFEETKVTPTFWGEFVKYLVTHLRLPLLSLTIIASYFYSSDPRFNINSPPDGWEDHQNYYRSLIPGFHKLLDNGLVDLNFRFLRHLSHLKDEYVELVMNREQQALERS